MIKDNQVIEPAACGAGRAVYCGDVFFGVADYDQR